MFHSRDFLYFVENAEGGDTRLESQQVGGQISRSHCQGHQREHVSEKPGCELEQLQTQGHLHTR